MKRGTAHIAVTAGLAAVLTVGSLPTGAIAEVLELDAAGQEAVSRETAQGDAETASDSVGEETPDAADAVAGDTDSAADPAVSEEVPDNAASNASEGAELAPAESFVQDEKAEVLSSQDVSWDWKVPSDSDVQLDGVDMLICLQGNVKLPANLTVIEIKDGTKQPGVQKQVTWTIKDQGAAEPNNLAAGTYDAVGTVEDAEGFEAHLNLVIESPDDITGYDDYAPRAVIGTVVSAPKELRVTFKDGKSKSFPVTMEALDAGAFQKRGWAVYNGVITGTSKKVTYRVNMIEPVAATVDGEDQLWAFAGSAAPVPSTGSITYIDADGRSTGYQGFITWDNLPENGIFDTPGTYTLTGRISCPSAAQYQSDKTLEVSTTIEVRAKPATTDELRFWCSLDTWTEPGQAPKLKTEVPLQDFYTGSVYGPSAEIEWDAVDPSLYAADKEGTSFTVHGTVRGFGLDVQCTVDVTRVKSVEVPSVMMVAGGILNAPENAIVKTADGKTRTCLLDVDNSRPSPDLSQPGTVQYPVMLTEIPNGSFLGGQTIYAEMTVHILGGYQGLAEGEALDDLLNLTTIAGLAPVLPTSVPVTLEDGSVISLDVTWDPVSADAFSKPGEVVEVTGTVQGSQSLPASIRSLLAATGGAITARVTVAPEGSEPVVSYIEPVYASTAAGAVLDVNLTAFGHQTVRLVMSDGTSRIMPVRWDGGAVDLNRPGTYMVRGAVEGIDQAAWMYVNVLGDEVAFGVHHINAFATKTEYKVGETFDPSTIRVSLVYDNGLMVDLASDRYTVSSPDMSTAGEKTVTVTLKDDPSKTAEVRITVGSSGDGGNTGEGGNSSGNGEDAGNKNDGAAPQDDGTSADALPQTGDPTSFVAGATGVTGAVALAGAWLARKRRK